MLLRVKHRPPADMFLNLRQLPNESTPGITMATTGGTPATDEASVPSQTTAADPDPTTAVESVSSAAAEPTTASENNNSQSSAVASASSSAQVEVSSSVVETQASETQASSAAAPSSSSENVEPTTSAEASSPQVTTTAVQTEESSASATEPASSDTNNDSSSSSDESVPSATNTSESEIPVSTTVVVTNSSGVKTSIVVVTTITTNQAATSTGSETSATTTSASKGVDSGSSSGGLNQKSKVAIGVVVPIAAIAILALIGLFWWRKRRSRKMAQEERRKEVEDYAFNPNADPTIPAVSMADGSYEMREDASSGYRGWGNTTVGSTGRKASTTMSGGQTGQAYSDVTSPTARMSDGRSGEPLMDGSYSPEGEILGAMGPSAANNRGADVHRGPSNASSSYSAARSDGSDPMGTSYGAGGTYYDQYGQNNPYNDNGPRPDAPPGAPVIRDNPARRNTRIENPSHYPQQSAGISQNF
ncbi:hypothetical protein G7Z17_g7395 [Cylindrodendrum hubeiense]|uniref:Serine-rich protein n=1 Tax=Cylindrodendrum hubeiense TaxID=595255 RepID=A0A9P5LFD1_9HYPO|nr:hypothetical protein G7Z17_g7395 [Cylindrodendrum hubeiense]